MIVDTLANVENYQLGSRFQKAFEFLKDPQTATLAPGHYVIEKTEDGVETVYANIQSYETRTSENCALEYHRAYADVQFLFEGNEAIGYRPLTADLETTKPYNADADIGFVAGVGTWVPFAQPDTFFVLFPSDAHAPGCSTVGGKVKKAVVKVRL